jgi:hypothetical protein
VAFFVVGFAVFAVVSFLPARLSRAGFGLNIEV